jgi:hypothetical protein
MARRCSCCIDSHDRYEKCRKLHQRYGISLAKKEEMISNQGNKCFLCDGPPNKIDHCHKSGRIRGVLCDKCNVWLAPFDDHSWMVRVASYLMPPLVAHE